MQSRLFMRLRILGLFDWRKKRCLTRNYLCTRSNMTRSYASVVDVPSSGLPNENTKWCNKYSGVRGVLLIYIYIYIVEKHSRFTVRFNFLEQFRSKLGLILNEENFTLNSESFLDRTIIIKLTKLSVPSFYSSHKCV